MFWLLLLGVYYFAHAFTDSASSPSTASTARCVPRLAQATTVAPPTSSPSSLTDVCFLRFLPFAAQCFTVGADAKYSTLSPYLPLHRFFFHRLHTLATGLMFVVVVVMPPLDVAAIRLAVCLTRKPNQRTTTFSTTSLLPPQPSPTTEIAILSPLAIEAWTSRAPAIP